ncbi:MAG: cell division protein SepF [Armatimonadetes bacterium]|nr:cell division protein SepF [Armatimonadota bacterium]MBS1711633.1 cell division protein SepF [Armatimonadota bacterium]MBX3109812.1 cell division protein SepF [Fimbriimonadaceae bacterium]
MEEAMERVTVIDRIRDFFTREEVEESDTDHVPTRSTAQRDNRLSLHAAHRYHVTVRSQIVSFQDAVAAADGLKRGEQQLLNLSKCPEDLREKIKDFMCGVNYNAEGTWEEVADNVFLLAPANAYVEVAPASQRMVAGRN